MRELRLGVLALGSPSWGWCEWGWRALSHFIRFLLFLFAFFCFSLPCFAFLRFLSFSFEQEQITPFWRIKGQFHSNPPVCANPVRIFLTAQCRESLHSPRKKSQNEDLKYDYGDHFKWCRSPTQAKCKEEYFGKCQSQTGRECRKKRSRRTRLYFPQRPVWGQHFPNTLLGTFPGRGFSTLLMVAMILRFEEFVYTF